MTSDAPTGPGLSIGEVAARTGVAEGTLRMWETRHGFPTPGRLASGHRRYSEEDLRRVLSVARAREAGLSLEAAIDRARRLDSEPRPSVFAGLRDRFDHLHPQPLPKRALVWLSRALEDEVAARSPGGLLFGAFQQERFYRQAEYRWRRLARSCDQAFALADFATPRRPSGGPAEIALASTDVLMSEWVIVCDAPRLPACLVGWERPAAPSGPRVFEMIWSVEPAVVREAARICRELVARTAPELVDDLAEPLAEHPAPAGPEHAQIAVAVSTRLAAYAAHRAG
jgi:MerR family transcriptional regulator, light-induced transcriptional regulator